MRTTPLVLAALALCGCPPPARSVFNPVRAQAPQTGVVRTPDEALAQAIELERAGRGSVAAYQAIVGTYPSTPAAREALFRAGKLAVAQGDYPTGNAALAQLLYEHPVAPNASEARMLLGISALELRRYRDAQNALEAAIPHLSGADRARAQEALGRAIKGAERELGPLRAAIARAGAVEGGAQLDGALTSVAELADQAPFLALAEAWNGTPSTHPAWPLLTFKMARIYNHLGDWNNLQMALAALLREAPASAYTPQARALQTRLSRKSTVNPKSVGALLPLSGRYKAFGESALRGLQLALDGSGIALIAKDTAGDPSVTASMVESLVLDDQVIAIVGPLLTEDAKRAALKAEELGVTLMTLSRAEGITNFGPHVFRVMVTNAQQADALAGYAFDVLGFRTFAMMYPSTPFGLEMAGSFWDAVVRRGGEIRGAEPYGFDQKTFTEEAKKLVGRFYLDDRADFLEATRDASSSARGLTDFQRRKVFEKLKARLPPVVDFEALLIPDSWAQVSLVAPALAVEDIITNGCDSRDVSRIQATTGRSKLPTVTLLGPSTWASPRGQSGRPMLIERGGKYVQCGIYVDGFFEDSQRPATRAFVDAFHEAHPNVSITLLDAMAYDAGALVRRVATSGNPSTREAFRDALQNVRGFAGATGDLSFSDSREVLRKMFFLELRGSGIRELLPGERPSS